MNKHELKAEIIKSFEVNKSGLQSVIRVRDYLSTYYPDYYKTIKSSYINDTYKDVWEFIKTHE